jgi:phosphoribosylamine--glycine ligase
MGAYSPAPVVTAEVERRILDQVIEPTVRGMAAEGAPFVGFLYAGLMIDAQGAPRVVEFNVRLGDPEAQPLLLRLHSDLLELVQAALDGELAHTRANWDPRPALGVVLSATGYPERPRTGDPIEGLEAAEEEGLKVFHAGTRADPDGIVRTAGGRVLTVCASGEDLAVARLRAYRRVDSLHFADMAYRRDIAAKALRR